MKPGSVYIVTNRPNGVLYIGVTSDLVGRIWEHRSGLVEGFTRRYGCKILVWFDDFDDIRDAIAAEKRMKGWLRAWKVRLIRENNPDWADLYPSIAPGAD